MLEQLRARPYVLTLRGGSITSNLRLVAEASFRFVAAFVPVRNATSHETDTDPLRELTIPQLTEKDEKYESSPKYLAKILKPIFDPSIHPPRNVSPAVTRLPHLAVRAEPVVRAPASASNGGCYRRG